jgi:hypothetical protein
MTKWTYNEKTIERNGKTYKTWREYYDGHLFAEKVWEIMPNGFEELRGERYYGITGNLDINGRKSS